MKSIKLENCKEEHIESIIGLINSTELGELYFSNNTEKIRVAVIRQFELERVLVAIDENENLIGLLMCDKQGTFGKYPFIHMIAVSPEFQSLGYGTKMLKAVEESYNKADMKYFLLVAEKNTRAKKLYENIGYNEVGRIDGFYVQNQVEVLMMKSN